MKKKFKLNKYNELMGKAKIMGAQLKKAKKKQDSAVIKNQGTTGIHHVVYVVYFIYIYVKTF